MARERRDITRSSTLIVWRVAVEEKGKNGDEAREKKLLKNAPPPIILQSIFWRATYAAARGDSDRRSSSLSPQYGAYVKTFFSLSRGRGAHVSCPKNVHSHPLKYTRKKSILLERLRESPETLRESWEIQLVWHEKGAQRHWEKKGEERGKEEGGK